MFDPLVIPRRCLSHTLPNLAAKLRVGKHSCLEPDVVLRHALSHRFWISGDHFFKRAMFLKKLKTFWHFFLWNTHACAHCQIMFVAKVLIFCLVILYTSIHAFLPRETWPKGKIGKLDAQTSFLVMQIIKSRDTC